MLEHLSNCHGELTALMAAIASIPFIGHGLVHLLRRFRRPRQEKK